ncbi:cytochrome P450 [Pendulispora albinea]|uniref:Cytochrome P450 n=1 Tax=Pendulispora albinea TaxID=2741071 RepID=A0ABZ2M055_9BACT
MIGLGSTFAAVAAVCVLGTLPGWLPALVVRLRMKIFTRINGDEGLSIPGERVGLDRYRQVYAHPAANGRSHGAALSDLFWYWLSPGAEIHQEHLEAGERYEDVARTTRRILALARKDAERLADHCVDRVLDAHAHDARGTRAVRLRDLMMPIWARFYYEVVFGAPCPSHACALIVGNAHDVVTSLKCCGLRHMARRHRLTAFLRDALARGEVPHELPEGLTEEERAYYLQGVFFNTAIVQMSEAMTHLLLAIAQHPNVQADLHARMHDDRAFDAVIAETLRVYPLFGIAHRITTDDIALEGGDVLPKGSVLCFNYPEYHRAGFEDPDRFDPARWDRLSPREAREANYIPFGVAANRPCPAQAVALTTMRAVARGILRRYVLRSSATHTRSIPNRGPCLLVPREAREHASSSPARSLRARLAWMRFCDRWEDVGRSFVQLVLGTYMVWDAKRLRLCERHFERQRLSSETTPQPLARSGGCPWTTR